MRLGVTAALAADQIIEGDVSVTDGLIDGVGLSPAGSKGLAVPGFVDVQINGFDGVDFTTANQADYDHLAARLAATGVTTILPTLISLPPPSYLSALNCLADVKLANLRMPGMHLEGPFLSEERCGAHDPTNMLDPDPDLMKQFLEAGPIAGMTLAPERAGALELIDLLVAKSIVVSLGHSDADAATAHAAFERGARSVTHIFGAQRPWKHRDPGISGAALTRKDVYITAIVDGVHLADDAVRLAAQSARDRFVLITDTTAAGGRPDGRYRLGNRTVFLKDGACRLEDGTLAGSALTMDQAVRNMVGLGFDPTRAFAAATRAPAELIGRPELGTLEPGTPADICVLDDRFEVIRTLLDGVETFRR